LLKIPFLHSKEDLPKKSFDKNGFIVHSYREVNSGKESEDRKGTRLIPLRLLFL